MRHGKKIKKIGRSASHRKATLQSMSAALIEHKRITTTLGKARALRHFVEPILSRSKDDSTGSRRQAFRRLQNKDAVKALYGEIADAIGDRPGGYTRVVKLGQRQGDAAEMAVIELVDFNDVKPEGSAGTRRKTRRSRRRGGSSSKPKDIDRTGQAAVEENASGAAAVLPAGAPTAASAAAADAGAANASSTEASADVEEAPATDDAPSEADQADQAGEAAASEAANPDTTGNPQIPQTEAGADHPDAEQGADTGTGEPPPEAQPENQGRSGDAR